MTYDWLADREREMVQLTTVSLSHPSGTVRLMTADYAGIVVQSIDSTGAMHEYFLPWHEVKRIERNEGLARRSDYATHTGANSQGSSD